jgi:hypothetical protein
VQKLTTIPEGLSTVAIIYAVPCMHAQEYHSQVGPDLFMEAEALKDMLRQRLGWEFDMEVLPGSGEAAGGEEDDDDGPVVVENPQDWVVL